MIVSVCAGKDDAPEVTEAARLAAVRKHLKAGGDPDEVVSWDDGHYRAPMLHRAAAEGHVAVGRLLVEHGAALDSHADSEETTALHLAVENERPAFAKFLIDAGAKLDERDEEGFTPLHYAARGGSETLCKLLLAAGANIDMEARRGETPVQVALEGRKDAAVRLLLACGAARNIPVTAALGDMKALRKAVKANPGHVNAVVSQYRTPLCYAAQYGQIEAGRYLLAHGATLWGESRINSLTPLHVAATAGQKAFALFLLDRGADINAVYIDKLSGAIRTRELTPAVHAYLAKQLDLVELFAKKGIIFDSATSAGILRMAAEAGHEELLCLMLDRGAQVSRGDEQDRTALHLAVGNEAIVKLLLAHGADPIWQDDTGKTPLDLARESGNKVTTRLLAEATKKHKAPQPVYTPSCDAEARLLAKARALYAEDDTIYYSRRDRRSGPPGLPEYPHPVILAEAARRNFRSVGKYLVAMDECPRREWGGTGDLLDTLALDGRVAELEFVLACGADLGLYTHQPVLHTAVWRRRVEAVRALLSHGADPNAWPPSALHMAIEEEHTEIAKLLVEHGADVNARDSHGVPVIQYAAWTKTPGCVEYLLRKGAKPDLSSSITLGKQEQVDAFLRRSPELVKARYGIGRTTPLHLAVNAANLPAVRALLDKGADINDINKGGLTPLAGAAAHGNLELMRMLMANGADINRISNTGVCPVTWALEYGQQEAFDLLMARKAKIPGVVGLWRKTPLHLAVDSLMPGAVEALLKAGVSVNEEGLWGQRPLDELSYITNDEPARRKKQKQVLTLLLRYGADMSAEDCSGWPASTLLEIAESAGRTDIVKMLRKAPGKGSFVP